jgi:S-adenosylmethionine decarboxylase
VNYLIRHIIIELHTCDRDIINDTEALDTLLRDVADRMGTEVISGISHKFDPQGVTAMLIVGASHLSVHSWPEHAYASADLVVCTEGFVLQEIIDFIKDRVQAQHVNFIEFRRGLIEEHVHTHAH